MSQQVKNLFSNKVNVLPSNAGIQNPQRQGDVFNKGPSSGTSIFSQRKEIIEGGDMIMENASQSQQHLPGQQSFNAPSGKELFKSKINAGASEITKGGFQQPQQRLLSGVSIFKKQSQEPQSNIQGNSQIANATPNIFLQPQIKGDSKMMTPVIFAMQQNTQNIIPAHIPTIFNPTNIFGSRNELNKEVTIPQESSCNIDYDLTMGDVDMGDNKIAQMTLNLNKEIPSKLPITNQTNTSTTTNTNTNFARSIPITNVTNNGINGQQIHNIKIGSIKEPSNLQEFEDIVRELFDIPRII